MSPCDASERPVWGWVPGPVLLRVTWDGGGGTCSTICSGLSLTFSCLVFHSCIFLFSCSVSSMYRKCFTLLVPLRNKDCWNKMPKQLLNDKAAPKWHWPECLQRAQTVAWCGNMIARCISKAGWTFKLPTHTSNDLNTSLNLSQYNLSTLFKN